MALHTIGLRQSQAGASDPLSMAQILPSRRPDTEYHVSPIETSYPTQTLPHDNSNDNAQPSPVSPIAAQRTRSDSDTHSSASSRTAQAPSTPSNVDPLPAYIAPAEASRVVSEHLATQEPPPCDTEDSIDGAGGDKDDINFSAPALAHINAFLDQLLYSILSAAKSTSLKALRPAVTEVLKQRLAKEAVESADAELAELLAGGDEEEELDTAKHVSQEEKRRWDLELVWKRTRLRVMVYMRLGEMEDEDEQRYVQAEELFYGVGGGLGGAVEQRFSSSTGLVSWSAAIFLTSVLEFVAEQTLHVAGQAAYSRLRRQSSKHRRSISTSTSADAVVPRGITVEDHDVEKVALNSTLGRLWRTWRKSLRTNAGSGNHYALISQPPASPARSRASRENTVSAADRQAEAPDVLLSEAVIAANIPLPIAKEQSRDIDEIAVEGLARGFDHGGKEGDRDFKDDTRYSDLEIAPLVALPLLHEERDVDEIMVEGLARDPDDEHEDDIDQLAAPYPELMLALLVALPVPGQARDIEEIEVPGLARDPDAEDDESEWMIVSPKESIRRQSFAGFPPSAAREEMSGVDEPSEAFTGRARSRSLPLASRPPVLSVESVQSAAPSKADNVAEERSWLSEESQDDDLEEPPVIPPRATGHTGSEADRALEGTANKSEATPDAEGAITAHEDTRPAPAALAGIAAAAPATALAAYWSNNTAQLPEPVDRQNVGEQPVRDAADLDNQKVPADLKDLMLSNGTSGGVTQTQTPRAPGLQPPIDLLATKASDESFTLDSQRSQANSSKLSSVSDVRNGNDTATPQARDVVKPAVSPLSTNSTSEVPRAPRSPRAILDLTTGESVPSREPSTVVEGSRDAVSSSGVPAVAPKVERAPLETDGALPVAAVERTPLETNGVVRSTTPASSKEKSFESGVQEHPIVQKMASLKSSEGSSPTSPSDRTTPLTSAAIRGPEDFDSFVNGSATLKYTLTPSPVRDVPNDNPVRYAMTRDSSADMDAVSTSKTPPPASANRTGRALTAGTKTSTSMKRRSQSRPTPQNPDPTTTSGLTAREPRIVTESTRDFSDFIRSTGPDRETPVQPILTKASSASLRSAHIQGASAVRSASPGGAGNTIIGDAADIPSVPRIARRHKTGMEARDAKISDNATSALAEFIRSGPRSSTEAQADTPSSRAASSRISSSNRMSVSSRSALLSNGHSSTAPAVQPVQSTQSRGFTNGTNGLNEPVRQRHRGQDPYYVDFDDDEEDYELFNGSNANSGSEARTSRKEEGLFEFLRNQEPMAPSAPPQPLIDPNSALARKIIANARAGKGPSDGRDGFSANGLPSMPAGNTRLAPHLQQTPSNRQNTPPSKPKLQPKSSGSILRHTYDAESGNSTAGLAEFIRNSGPPDDPGNAPAPLVGREANVKKSSKQNRTSMFSLGKNSRYIDIP